MQIPGPASNSRRRDVPGGVLRYESRVGTIGPSGDDPICRLLPSRLPPEVILPGSSHRNLYDWLHPGPVVPVDRTAGAVTVRLASAASDAPAVAAIYRPLVMHTHASFEEVAPDSHEMERRIDRTLERTPWLVAENDGAVIGYAYALSHRDRAAYRWSLDISVYVGEDWQGRGIGRSLYGRLLDLLERQGFMNVYAGIALPNEASERLHRAIGMHPIGVYHQVGFKLGRWWDVAWYGMRLRQADDMPAEPVPLPALL